MADQFVGEIRIVGFNFPPFGWATCDGQIMPISQNTALFSLLGTQYGGDGKSNFALPNLQGSAPLAYGNGAGLTQRVIGETGGSQTVTLLTTEIPVHTHTPPGSTAGGNVNSPIGAGWAHPHSGKTGVDAYTANAASNVFMNPAALASVGGNQSHNNMSPYQVLTFVIALQGIFPSRG